MDVAVSDAWRADHDERSTFSPAAASVRSVLPRTLNPQRSAFWLASRKLCRARTLLCVHRFERAACWLRLCACVTRPILRATRRFSSSPMRWISSLLSGFLSNVQKYVFSLPLCPLHNRAAHCNAFLPAVEPGIHGCGKQTGIIRTGRFGRGAIPRLPIYPSHWWNIWRRGGQIDPAAINGTAPTPPWRAPAAIGR